MIIFQFDILYESGAYSKTKKGNSAYFAASKLRTLDSFFEEFDFSKTLGELSKRFDERFENTFHLVEKGFDKEHIDLAKLMLSNMIGGIG